MDGRFSTPVEKFVEKPDFSGAEQGFRPFPTAQTRSLMRFLPGITMFSALPGHQAARHSWTVRPATSWLLPAFDIDREPHQSIDTQPIPEAPSPLSEERLITFAPGCPAPEERSAPIISPPREADGRS